MKKKWGISMKDSFARSGVQHNATILDAREIDVRAPTTFSEAKEIYDRERRHHAFVRTPQFSDRNGFRTIIGDEHQFLRYLDRLEELAIKIERRKARPIELSKDRKGRSITKLTRIGRLAQGLCKAYDPGVLRFYERHEFSPRLAVMLDAMKKWAEDVVHLPLVEVHFGGISTTPIEILFKEVRRSLKSKKVASAIKNHRRMERQNFRSCWNYMQWLLDEKRSRLLILRIDLYYRAFSRDWGASVEAQGLHSKYMRALREDRIIKDVMGSISKREVGVDRGVHYHMLAVVDGHLHWNAAHLTRMLGERWIEVCGQDPGAQYPKAAYFNCYVLKDKYKYNCIGLIRKGDASKIKGLEIAIRYMCKETCHLRAGAVEILDKNGEVIRRGTIGKRNIRKGIVKKIKGKKRGARRKNP